MKAGVIYRRNSGWRTYEKFDEEDMANCKMATHILVTSNDKIQFVNVVVMSKFPELYSKISDDFDDKASEIYAQRECESSRNDAPAF